MSHPDIQIPDSIADEEVMSLRLHGVLTKKGGRRVFEMLKDATAEQWLEANRGLNPPKPSTDPEQLIELTNTWLSLRSQLSELPTGGRSADPFKSARERLTAEVKAAYHAMMDAGGPA